MAGGDWPEWLDLHRASQYACVSRRWLQQYVGHSERPLPCRRVAGKLLMRRDDFDRWLEAWPRVDDKARQLDAIVSEVMQDLRQSG